jgi:hypothetical protein
VLEITGVVRKAKNRESYGQIRGFNATELRNNRLSDPESRVLGLSEPLNQRHGLKSSPKSGNLAKDHQWNHQLSGSNHKNKTGGQQPIAANRLFLPVLRRRTQVDE